MRWSLAVLFAAAVATAQVDPPDGPVLPDHSWGNVAGCLVDSWGVLVPGVELRLECRGTVRVTRTDPSGRFLFAGVDVSSEGDSATIVFPPSSGYPATTVFVPPGAVLAPQLLCQPGSVTSKTYQPETVSFVVPFAGRSAASAVPWAGPWSIFATREGLVGYTTANGHVIKAADHFVALPSKRALNASDTSGDYQVELTYGTKSVRVPVLDIGPWNTKDDWWHDTLREAFPTLERGLPEAMAAFRDGFNGGLDGSGRKVVSGAGIDLADGVFYDDLGLSGNGTIQVRLLWKLTAVAGDRVRLKQWANVRDSAAGKLLFKADCGESGRVSGAPRAGVSGGRWYLYWPVAWDRGTVGWVVENYLTRDTGSVSCSNAVGPRGAGASAIEVVHDGIRIRSAGSTRAALRRIRPDGRILSSEMLAIEAGETLVRLDRPGSLEIVQLVLEGATYTARRVP